MQAERIGETVMNQNTTQNKSKICKDFLAGKENNFWGGEI